MATQRKDVQRAAPIDGWDRMPERIEPLAGQIGLFDYRPHVELAGRGELFDTGRDLPGADEHEQQILWDVEG